MFVEAKEFSRIPFDSIPISRRSSLFFYHHTQSMEPQFILEEKEDEPFRLNPLPQLHRPSEILWMVDSLLLCEPELSFHLNRQPFPPLRSPPLQDLTAAFGAHPLQESMGPLASEIARLICPLHGFPLFFISFFLKLLNF